MLEKLKQVVQAAVDALRSNGVHGPRTADALESTHEFVVALDARVKEIEDRINAGLDVAGKVSGEAAQAAGAQQAA